MRQSKILVLSMMGLLSGIASQSALALEVRSCDVESAKKAGAFCEELKDIGPGKLDCCMEYAYTYCGKWTQRQVFKKICMETKDKNEPTEPQGEAGGEIESGGETPHSPAK